MGNVLSIIGVSEGRKEDDFYSTPSRATRLLLKKESFGNRIFEPACGIGAISNVLLENGYWVYSSDKIDRGYTKNIVDFFDLKTNPDEHFSIVTNPPFQCRYNNKIMRVEDWLLRSFEIGAGKVALFLKTTALAGKRRSEIFEKSGFKKLWQFRERVSLYRSDIEMDNSGMMDFAWFIFEKNYNGEPTIGWLY